MAIWHLEGWLFWDVHKIHILAKCKTQIYCNAMYTLHDFSPYSICQQICKNCRRMPEIRGNWCLFMQVTIVRCALSKTQSETIADAARTPVRYFAC